MKNEKNHDKVFTNSYALEPKSSKINTFSGFGWVLEGAYVVTMGLYQHFQGNPKTKWKDSMKKIQGLERTSGMGLDI